MKKITVLFTVLLIISVSILLVCINRLHRNTNYEAFIRSQNQKFSKMMKKSDEKEFDNPERAAYLNFIQTMDPALGRVPVERLYPAYLQMLKIRKNNGSNKSEVWQNIPSNMGGRTRAMMWDPNDSSGKKVWAGSVTGGLWKNMDITNSSSPWIPISDFWDNLSISAIVSDPNNPNIFYVGTGEAQTAVVTYRESSGRGSGIWKSTDAGQTWTHLSSTIDFAYVTDIIVRNEGGNSVVYAGVVSGIYEGSQQQSLPTDGLYRSTDGGNTWTQVLPNISGESVPYAVSDIELASNGRIFVGTSSNLGGKGGATILYSDAGTSGTWTLSADYNSIIIADPTYNIPGRIILAAAPSNPDIVYACVGAGSASVLLEGFGTYVGRYILKTTNGGTTWNELPTPADDNNGHNWAYLSWHAMTAAVDPNNPSRIFIGGLDVCLSEDGGNTWNRISDWSLMYSGGGTNYAHADQHKMLFKHGSSSEIMFSNDGGVFYSNNANQSTPTFQERNTNYTTLQFYTCDIDQTTGSTSYIGGVQDNGALLYQGTPLYYANDMYTGGDGAYCFFDPNEPLFYTSWYDNQYYAFSNGNSYDITQYYCGLFVNPSDYDGVNNILYTNAMDVSGNHQDQLLRITGLPANPSGTFFTLNTGSTVPYSHVKLSPHNANTLFIGTESGKVYKVTNLSTTPQAIEIDNHLLPSGNVSCIAVGSTDNDLLVTFSNYGIEKIWITHDGGSNWMDKTGNLPDIPVRWAIFYPTDNDEAMIATELGVWTTNELGIVPTNWYPSNNGLANVRTDMLRIRTSDNTVLAATHGRGLFTTTFEYNPYTNINSIESSDEINVYPNPAKNELFVSDIQKAEKMQIISVNGKCLKSIPVISENTNINISDLPQGVYFLEINYSAQSKIVRRFVKN